jgi:hypothetical protein
MTAVNYSTPCDRCGLAGGIEGLVPDGRWPNGSARHSHPSCRVPEEPFAGPGCEFDPSHPSYKGEARRVVTEILIGDRWYPTEETSDPGVVIVRAPDAEGREHLVPITRSYYQERP